MANPVQQNENKIFREKGPGIYGEYEMTGFETKDIEYHAELEM